MNKISNITFGNKEKLTKFSILILLMFYSNIAKAQPGWRDLTARYFYTIVDENGKKISFKNNNDYSIMIDSILYKSSNIPNDSLKPAGGNYDWDKGYENQIKINDFSMVNYQKKYYQSKKRLEIKIIHKKDTMYICQPSGTGSAELKVLEINGVKSGHKVEPQSDFTLRFIAGHYYFPDWAKTLTENLPKTTGSVKIANVSQRHFIVPRNVYDLVLYNKNKHQRFANADNQVVNNFIKGFFSVDKRIEPTKFDKSALPYKNPYWASQLYLSKDSNRYYGMIGYSTNLSNCTSFKKIFTVLNKKENTIEQFFPKENPRVFSSGDLYIDTFNTILYLPVWIKKEFDYNLSDCQYDLPREKYIYRSEDEGRTWQKDKTLKELFDKYDFKNFEFLDKNYAVGFSRKKSDTSKKNEKKYNGVFYLLKNMRVIDSLKSLYDDNFYSKNDTIFFRKWMYSERQPIITIVNEKLKNLTVNIPQSKNNKESREYQNFYLNNNRELVFKNCSGSLTLMRNVVEKAFDITNGYFVLEKGNQIYLINSWHIYISFDKGSTWYLYPLPLEERNYNYRLLDINEQNKISHFSDKRIDREDSGIRKIIHNFSPE